MPALPEEATTRPGDLWLLGEHRLLCGDSTKIEDVARVMAGERAALMFTDPPYLVDYDGGNHPQTWGKDGRAITSEEKTRHWDDYTDPEQASTFFHDFLIAAYEAALVPEAAVYQCFGMMRADLVYAAWRAAGLLPHQTVIWKKSRPVLGRCWFMYNYEPILAGWLQGHQPQAKPPNNEYAVWEIANGEGVEDGVAGTHPTIKPVELVRRPIEWHTAPGDLIYEPFSWIRHRDHRRRANGATLLRRGAFAGLRRCGVPPVAGLHGHRQPCWRATGTRSMRLLPSERAEHVRRRARLLRLRRAPDRRPHRPAAALLLKPLSRACPPRTRGRALQGGRRRAASGWWYPQPDAAELEAALTQLVGLPAGPPERVVEGLIMEARSLAAAFGVAARQLPPQLAWRCEAMAEQIAGALTRFLEVP